MPHRDSGNGIVPPGADPCGDVSSHAATSSEPSAGFTPGPWSVQSGDVWSGSDDRPDTPLFRPRGQDPYRRWGRQVSDVEQDANARLIAAAPDGYAAAKDALAGWRYIRSHHGDLYGVGWDRVEKALADFIAKAEFGATQNALSEIAALARSEGR